MTFLIYSDFEKYQNFQPDNVKDLRQHVTCELLLFVTTKEEFSPHMLRDSQMHAASLHKRVLGSEEDFDSRKLDELAMVDHRIYNQYIYNYLADEPIKP